jgi:hypothetical protein
MGARLNVQAATSEKEAFGPVYEFGATTITIASKKMADMMRSICIVLLP